MSMKEDIRPVTFLKNRCADLLAQIHLTQRPVIITQNGTPRGVLQDVETYERMRQALGLLKIIAQGEFDVHRGRTLPQKEVFSQIRKKLKSRPRKHENPGSL